MTSHMLPLPTYRGTAMLVPRPCTRLRTPHGASRLRVAIVRVHTRDAVPVVPSDARQPPPEANDLRSAVLGYSKEVVTPYGVLTISPLRHQWIFRAADIMTDAFAEGSETKTLYRMYLRRQIVKYLDEHIAMPPRAIVLSAVLKVPRPPPHPTSAAEGNVTACSHSGSSTNGLPPSPGTATAAGGEDGVLGSLSSPSPGASSTPTTSPSFSQGAVVVASSSSSSSSSMFREQSLASESNSSVSTPDPAHSKQCLQLDTASSSTSPSSTMASSMSSQLSETWSLPESSPAPSVVFESDGSTNGQKSGVMASHRSHAPGGSTPGSSTQSANGDGWTPATATVTATATTNGNGAAPEGPPPTLTAGISSDQSTGNEHSSGSSAVALESISGHSTNNGHGTDNGHNSSSSAVALDSSSGHSTNNGHDTGNGHSSVAAASELSASSGMHASVFLGSRDDGDGTTEDEELVGVVEVSFDSSTRTQYMTLNAPDKCGYMCNMAVDPAYRRRGFAQLLIHSVEDLVRMVGEQKLFLHLRFQDKPAAGLYRAAGFVKHSEEPWLVTLIGSDRRYLLLKHLGAER